MKHFLLIFSISVILHAVAYAADTTDSASVSKLRNIEKQLVEIEKTQKETLAVQEAMIQDIKNLKIIVNKR